ncbi:LOW QUALITY PROTEIN: nucleosome-remodeling factor subunit BPTF-like [Limulus polyphemus]|uniref:LOW QUALITY PROTEIN: nucleosome-remodeling factor subunit BPTF-like n=1 Tax=Limulus polyphemus TaxID=6850 RepID=A0ABM1STV9_LIMPO|nr:LOW QUALITY PROTEIN: nucleosome-remodeling factor subunit BPTF-like [Limulus polyphemus]
MSGRGRRGRGRPPKSVSLSRRTQKKPRYLYAGSGGPNSRLSISDRTDENSSSGAHVRYKSRLREKALKEVITFLKTVMDDDYDGDSDFGMLSSESEYEKDEIEAVESDESYESDNQSVLSQSSFSTISSTPVKRKWVRRPRSPVFLQEREKPPLELPKSSEDLLLPNEHLMSGLGVYEVLRHFRNILRLTGFRFEDFCAALMSDEQSALISDIHIMLLKAILREEEATSTMFGPQDQRDSMNIHFYIIDGMTWPEVLRMYLQSDEEYRYVLDIFQNCEYPFTNVSNKLRVLQFLCDQFLTTYQAKEEITSEGLIRHDDHCRVCHKLGDLLCCENCPAVYHLACIDPPLEEVPSEDWVCDICKSNEVSGVTDCITDYERSGLLSRQDSLGWDREGRKYWFLCRRIFVEGNGEVFYYSTKPQIEELLNVLDPNDFEADLCRTIKDLQEEMIRQMDVTEKLTNAAKGSRKSYFDVENAALIKHQEERALQKIQDEEKRLQTDENKFLENQTTEGQNIETSNFTTTVSTTTATVVSTSEKVETQELSNSSKENVDQTDTVTTIMTKTTTTTTTTNIETNLNAETEIKNDEQEEDLEKESDKKKENGSGDLLIRLTKVKEDSDKQDTVEIADESQSEVDKKKSENMSDRGDGNGDGNSPRPGYITRSKTGSLTPRVFNLEYSTNRNRKGEEGDSVLVIGKDGQVNRMTRAKSSASSTTGSVLFKLGMEDNYKKYTNEYTTNPLALNKHQHAEDRDKKRHLSHKFSLTTLSEFKWNGSIYGSRSLTVSTLRATILQLENSIHSCFFHPNWPIHRNNWIKAVNACSSPSTFSLALSILEMAMKPVLFNPAWNESLGHTRLQRTTMSNREDRKKQEKREKREMLEEENERVMFIKYTLGLKHQVWKQKGEEYRINGQGGWMWISSTRMARHLSSCNLGLRGGPAKVVLALRGGQSGAKIIDAWGGSKCKDVPVSIKNASENFSGSSEKSKCETMQSLVAERSTEDGDNQKEAANIVNQTCFNNVKEEQKNMELDKEDYKVKEKLTETSEVVQEQSVSPVKNEVDEEKMDVDKTFEISAEKDACKIDDASEIPNFSEADSTQTFTEESKTDLSCNVDADKVEKSHSIDLPHVQEKDFGEYQSSEKGHADDSCLDKQIMHDLFISDKPNNGNKAKRIELSENQKRVMKSSIMGKLSYLTVSQDLNMDLINVSESLKATVRTVFPKIAKASKLDVFLERRLKMNEMDLPEKQNIKENTNTDKAAVKEEKDSNAVSIKPKQPVNKINSVVQDNMLYVTTKNETLEDADNKVLKLNKEETKLHLELDIKSADKRSLNSLPNGEVGFESDSELVSVKENELSKPLTTVCYSTLCRSNRNKEKPRTCYAPLCSTRLQHKVKIVPKVSTNESIKNAFFSKNSSINEKEIVKKTEPSVFKSPSSPPPLQPIVSKYIPLITNSPTRNGKMKNSVKSTVVKTTTVTEVKTVVVTQSTVASTTSFPMKEVKDNFKNNCSVKETVTYRSSSETSQSSTISTDTDGKVSVSALAMSQQAADKKTVTVMSGGGRIRTSARTTTESRRISQKAGLNATVNSDGTTAGKVYLSKLSKSTKKTRKMVKSSLPSCYKFKTTIGKKHSILVIPTHELRKLSRHCGMKEVSGFNYVAKTNQYIWPYGICPRPIFKICWRYRTKTISSIHAAALQLRVLWCSLRWDDIQAKPPPGGVNTISTENEVTTTELLKSRSVGLFNQRSEYLVRRIIVPIDLPSRPREKATPQRSGLRERRRAESPVNKEPFLQELWVPEEELELWEIKQFGEKLEKQQQQAREKIAHHQAQQSADKIRAQMEAQLQQQRQAMQQKRLLDSSKQTPQQLKNSTSQTQPKIVTAKTITVALTPGSSGVTTLTPLSSLNSSAGKVQVITATTPGKAGIASLVATASTPTGQPYKGIRRIFTTRGPRPDKPGGQVVTAVASSSGGGTTLKLPIGAAILPKSPQIIVRASTASTSSGTVSGLATKPTVLAVAGGGQINAQGPKTGIIQTQTTQGSPVRAQIHIFQGTNGQLQVRGLLPGQQLIRMADGRLQLLTLPTVQTSTVQQTGSKTQLSTIRPSVALTSAVSTAVVTGSTGVVCSSSTGTPVAISLPGIGTIAATATAASGSTVQLVTQGQTTQAKVRATTTATGAVATGVTTTAGTVTVAGIQMTPKVVHIRPQVQASGQQQTIIQTQSPVRPAVQPSVQQLRLQNATVNIPGIGTVITTPVVSSTSPIAVASVSKNSSTEAQVLSIAPGQLTVSGTTTSIPSTVSILRTTGAATKLLTSSSSVKIDTKKLMTAPLQLSLSTSKTSTAPQISIGSKTQPSISPTSSSVGGGGSPPCSPKQFVLTPAITQQIVRQALLNPQTSPEVQQKLIALQRHHQQQLQKQQKEEGVVPQTSTVVTTDKNKAKIILSPEQKISSFRMNVCQQVMKSILDKIEREEKSQQKKQKQKESAEEKKMRINTNKLYSALFKHTEALRKEIMRKRQLLEKELRQQVKSEEEYESNLESKAVSPTSPPKPKPALLTQKPVKEPVPKPPKKRKMTYSTESNDYVDNDKSEQIISDVPKPKKSKISLKIRSHKLCHLCRKPNEPSRFMAACDVCCNWFHVDCVGRTEEGVKTRKKFVCVDCERGDDEELYCFCQKPYDESQFYICCDRCQNWYHGRCVGVLQSEADTIDEYICPTCQGNTDINQANMKQLESKDYERLQKLFKSLQNHKNAWPFREPVNPKDVPDYYKVIKEPMDLRTIEKRIQEHQYEKLADFIGDMTKIFDNCRYYNPRNSPFYHCAEILESYFVQRIKAFREMIR